ncbi:MAG: hypothetical protein IKN39_03015 [Clostridia bacterium]|nr:hypothetical protein [Clostridia bacterium]
MNGLTCCFIGHRTINETEKLKAQIYEIVENLIVKEKVGTFLFGSKSRFNDLCYETVTEIKEKYPHIKRVYVRAEYPFIKEDYKTYLLEKYEDTYYPEKIIGAGKSVYIERNFEMIKNSDFCVIYNNEQTAPKHRKSGTQAAADYAEGQKKKIIEVMYR